MPATTPTTIRGVSILSGRKKRGGEVFEIALSYDGIEVRRPDRAAQLLSWNRVSEWEIEERRGYVLLTLRGQGATTPLVVPGWSLDDLELLMRDVTSNARIPDRESPAPVVDDASAATVAATKAASSAPPASTPAPTEPVSPPAPEEAGAEEDPTSQDLGSESDLESDDLALETPDADAVETEVPVPAAEPHDESTEAEGSRSAQRAPKRQRRRPSWRVPVTVVLLGALAAAVIVVLLQSAGIIDWSFLGPVA